MDSSTTQVPLPPSITRQTSVQLSWSDIDARIKNMHNRISGYKWIYNRMSLRCQYIDYVLSVFKIALGPIAGVLAFTFPADGIIWVKTIYSLIAIGSGAVAAIAIWFDGKDKAYNYRTYACRYSNLLASIDRQYALPSARREHPNNYLSWVQNKYEDLTNFEPTLHRDVVQKFVTTHPTYTQNDMPEIANILFDIPAVLGIKVTPRSGSHIAETMAARAASNRMLPMLPSIVLSAAPLPLPITISPPDDDSPIAYDSIGIDIPPLVAPIQYNIPTTRNIETLNAYTESGYNDATMQYELKRLRGGWTE